MSGQADIRTLETHVDEFRDILDKPTFLSRDIDKPKPERRSIIETLKSCNAIRSTGRVYPKKDETSGTGKPVHKWKWVDYREHLRKHLQERDELPCGCRSHIPPEREDGEFFCKFCGEGHDKQTVQEAL